MMIVLRRAKRISMLPESSDSVLACLTSQAVSL